MASAAKSFFGKGEPLPGSLRSPTSPHKGGGDVKELYHLGGSYFPVLMTGGPRARNNSYCDFGSSAFGRPALMAVQHRLGLLPLGRPRTDPGDRPHPGVVG